MRHVLSAELPDPVRAVYERHAEAVFGFFSYSVDVHTAQDLTSATFERVVRSWSSFDAERATERTWILSIARNLLTDHFRRQSHRRAASLDEQPGLLAEAGVVEADPLERRLSIEELKTLLGHVGAREREVLALRFGADLPAVQIAELMELSVANVNQILSRSLRRLRGHLGASSSA